MLKIPHELLIARFGKCALNILTWLTSTLALSPTPGVTSSRCVTTSCRLVCIALICIYLLCIALICIALACIALIGIAFICFSLH